MKSKSNYKSDPLFNNRKEERFCIRETDLEKVLRSGILVQDKNETTYIRNVYFDTSEHAMPLGNAARMRDYSTSKIGNFDLGKENHFIDTGYLSFNKKYKEREIGNVADLIDGLNSRFELRVTGFRPYIGVEYFREVFKAGGLRLTVDRQIDLSWINEDLSAEKIPFIVNSYAPHVEIKYGNEEIERANEIKAALRNTGGVTSVGKHAIAYNARWIKHRSNLTENLVNELPEKEYEIKYNVPNESSFMRFIMDLHKGQVEGFRRWEKYQNPFKITSFNEYKTLSPQKKARVMYFGTLEPKIVVKDRGTLTENGILLRTEEKYGLEKEIVEKALAADTIGISKRIKEILFVESISTGRLYPVTIDLNQTEDGRSLYQLEVEYYRSVSKQSSEAEILDEIDVLGKHFDKLGGLKRVETRKEDWVRGQT